MTGGCSGQPGVTSPKVCKVHFRKDILPLDKQTEKKRNKSRSDVSPLGEKWLREKNREDIKRRSESAKGLKGEGDGGKINRVRQRDRRWTQGAGRGRGMMAQLIVTNNRDTQRPHSLTSARTLTLCGLVMRTVAWMSRVQANRDKGENSLSS